MSLKLKKSKPALFIIPIVFLFAIAAGIIYARAEGSSDTGWRVNNGAVRDITIYDGTCKKITNNSGKDLFIPTKTSAEWNAFETNHPAGITIAPCIEIVLNKATGAACDLICNNIGRSCLSIGTDADATNNKIFEQGRQGGTWYPDFPYEGWYTEHGILTPCAAPIFADDGNWGHCSGSSDTGIPHDPCDKTSCEASGRIWRDDWDCWCPSMGGCDELFYMQTYCRCG